MRATAAGNVLSLHGSVRFEKFAQPDWSRRLLEGALDGVWEFRGIGFRREAEFWIKSVRASKIHKI